jgi:hypothetical protein
MIPGCPRPLCFRKHGPLTDAFTLPETVMAIALTVVVLGAAVASHLFGLRMIEMINDKASASAEARRNISTLMSEVCASKTVAVGSGNRTSFTEAGMDVPQKGTALQITPSTNTDAFIRYFLDTSAKALMRMTNGAATAQVVANAIKNTDLFTLEDLAGNVLTNNQNNCVVGLTLQFYQVQNVKLPVGATNQYTSYQVRSKMARRAL